MDPDAEQEFISIVTKITFLASSTDWDSEIASLIPLLIKNRKKTRRKIPNPTEKLLSLKPKMEFASLASHIRRFMSCRNTVLEWKFLFAITKIICFVSCMSLDSETELISLIKQIISLFNSKPDSESELVSLITQTFGISVDSEPTQESELLSLISQLVSLKPEQELTSLITHIISRFISMNWEPLQLISLCPEFHSRYWNDVIETEEGECNIASAEFWISTRKEFFFCEDCEGEYHREYEKAPLEIKHRLHPEHSLQLVFHNLRQYETGCSCCDEGLSRIHYCCKACDYAINTACVNKPSRLATDRRPVSREDRLIQFPSRASFWNL